MGAGVPKPVPWCGSRNPRVARSAGRACRLRQSRPNIHSKRHSGPERLPQCALPLQPTTIQERLAGEIPRAKAELAKHCTEITLTPEGDSYKLSGEWDLLGSVRSDGAGGQNRTGYARLFRAALYQ